MSDAPPADRVEVSLFGAGVGECVVVHIGGGEWIIIDSCPDKTGRSPVALSYLASLGVDVATRVKLVVLTHWHNDHFRGIADIVAAAHGARVVFSSALRAEEFRTLLAASKTAFMDEAGVEEIRRVIEVLEQRSGPALPSNRLWAVADRPLLTTDDVRVTALSPSDRAFEQAQQEFAQLLPREKVAKRRFVAQTPNSLSVVLLVEAGGRRVLLGADLERNSDQRLGWLAIVQSINRPAARAKVFKVPHHGSSNADEPAVWDSLLESDPIALVAPYAAGRTRRPSPGDVRRIKERTSRAFLTSPADKRTKSRDSALRRVIETATRDFRDLGRPLGQVRLRAPLVGSEDWSIQCLGAAVQL